MAAVFRWALLVLFVAASATKLHDHDRFLRTLTSIPWLPPRRARVAARAVPVVELFIALLLAVSPRAGAAAAVVTLAVFTGVVVTEIASGRRFECRCFGGTGTRAAGTATVARNAALIAAAAMVLLGEPSYPLPAALAGAGVGLLVVLVEIGTDVLIREEPA
ncbi:MAG TPA: MauE/DoxX family redox-associated membrane protein [Actinomycetota bacterium]|nr:MauE/DoxX family redox-associated membrane protein [Actinomycetota bacterium]